MTPADWEESTARTEEDDGWRGMAQPGWDSFLPRRARHLGICSVHGAVISYVREAGARPFPPSPPPLFLSHEAGLAGDIVIPFSAPRSTKGRPNQRGHSLQFSRFPPPIALVVLPCITGERPVPPACVPTDSSLGRAPFRLVSSSSITARDTGSIANLGRAGLGRVGQTGQPQEGRFAASISIA